MLQDERRAIIANRLEKFGVVKVADLSKELNATEVTIRHDLDELQNQGLAVRIHGGAKIKYLSGVKMTLEENAAKSVKERKIISEFAYSMVENNDSLILDSSATVLTFARLLKEDPFENLTILTTSLPVFNELIEVRNYSVILIGGKYNRNLMSTNGPLSYLLLRNIHVDKAFMGVAGIDIRNGLTGPYEEETEIKKLSIECADRSVLLADHSKFGRCFLYSFGRLEDVDSIITDTRPDERFIEKLGFAGVDLMY